MALKCNSFLRQQRRVRVRQANGSGLGGGIVRADDTTQLGGHGRQVDYPPPFALAHLRQDRLGVPEMRGDLDLNATNHGVTVLQHAGLLQDRT